MQIKIVGLGSGSMESLPVRNLQLLRKSNRIYLRTLQHPVVEDLKKLKINLEGFDHFYEKFDTFEEVYEAITSKILNEAKNSNEAIIYCVPGHPMVAETTVKMLIKEAKKRGISIEIIPAPSCIEAVYSTLQIDPSEGMIILDALGFERSLLRSRIPMLFMQVHNDFVASDLKLILMEHFEPDKLLKVIRAAGIPLQERVIETSLYELDRIDWFDHLTTIYVPGGNNLMELETEENSLKPLVEVMQVLRGENGCPWDKEQNHQTLKKYLLEETYEVIDAIDSGDEEKLLEELGDLLLQIIFHAQIAAENNRFDIDGVVNKITEKLKRRHPHVFADIKDVSCAEVEYDWDEIKREEKKDKAVLADVPRVFPALIRAEKLQRKASRVGFDWISIDGPFKKVEEELLELKEALDSDRKNEIKEELGDLFFALVNVCRFAGFDPEEVLQKTNDKFIRRFSYIERYILEENLAWKDIDLQKMNEIWEKSKKKL